MENNVCAIVVCNQPDQYFVDKILVLISQVGKVLIIENQADVESEKVLSLCQKLSDKVEVLKFKWDFGWASALNKGVRYIQDNKSYRYDWFLLIKQDTLVGPGHVSNLIASYSLLSEVDKAKTLMISPFSTHGYLSGCLVKHNSFSLVGYFDDDLFDAYIGADYSFHITKNNYKVLVYEQSVQISRRKDPAYQYYLVRNFLVTVRRFGKTDIKWVFRESFLFLLRLLVTFLVSNYRWQRVKALSAGIFDAAISRLGPLVGATYSRPKAEKYFVEERTEVFDLLPPRIDRMLDLGCGAGRTSHVLKTQGRVKWVCGVEGSPQAAQVARTRLDQVIEGDIEKLEYPFENETFDCVLVLDILEHLVDPWTTLEKVSKLLKPGGVIVASIPNVRHYTIVIPLMFFGDWRYQEEGLLDSTHIRFFTRKTAVQMMTSTGLKLDLLKYTGAKIGSFSGLINMLTFNLFLEFFILQNLIRVKKIDEPKKNKLKNNLSGGVL